MANEDQGQADAITERQRRARRERTSRLWVALTALAVMLGMLGGLGAFTFGYGDGSAYLGNDPASCANCHVMQQHYDSWVKSSHKDVATCNDCHLPHHPIGKWVTKADNGFFHSLAFTTDSFHEPIQIKPRNHRVTQGACLYCHAELVNHMLPAEEGGDMLACIHCHGSVGHAQR
jgi:cytochrome c nitrite reductase small subunit